MLHVASAPSAVVTEQEFTLDAADWETGTGSMTVSWTGAEGNPSGSLEGSFASQGFFFVPQPGSFLIDEPGSDFLGAYPGSSNITGFAFDFMALSVLPIDMSLNLYSGVNSYYVAINIASLVTNLWTTFTVSLADPNWTGNAGVLANVTAIELTITRGSAAAQQFYLDNFETVNTEFSPGGAIPEPSTGLMILYGGMYTYAIRRRMRGLRDKEYEEEGS